VMGLPRASSGRLVLIEWEGRRVAFAVSQALRMRSLDPERVLEKSDTALFTSGYTKVDDEDLMILDVESVILELEKS
jgi:chemotaxis signal transduction protein